MRMPIACALVAALLLTGICGTATAESFSSPLFPAFASMSISRSALDISSGSMSTALGASFIGTPPKINYGISITGVGDFPAFGEVSSFGSFHSWTPASDLSYSSTSSASGLIKSYSVEYSIHL